MKKTVLAVIAHSDDEALGIGGTLAKHAARGDQVYALAMTNGVGARAHRQDDLLKEARQRAQAAAKAGDILGLTWLEGGDFPDNALDQVALLQIAQSIEAAKAKVSPDIIYTHSAADLNIDHRRTCEATLAAFRPQPHETFEEIRSFEVVSATDYGHPAVTGGFAPNLYIDITKTWPQKLAALHEYDAEMRERPHCRSYEGLEVLARYRGFQAGLAMAEAFEVLKKIERS